MLLEIQRCRCRWTPPCPTPSQASPPPPARPPDPSSNLERPELIGTAAAAVLIVLLLLCRRTSVRLFSHNGECCDTMTVGGVLRRTCLACWGLPGHVGDCLDLLGDCLDMLGIAWTCWGLPVNVFWFKARGAVAGRPV